jgi:YVTN family beta-propeller protein
MIKQLRLFYCFTFLLTAALHAVPPNTVVATINVGVTPTGMAITPDGRFAYVANNNNYGIFQTPTVSADTVSVIDLSNNTVLTTIEHSSFSQPYTITINPAGTKAYVTNSADSVGGREGTTVTVIDIATNTVSAVITGFDGPSGLAITSDGTKGYVNNYGAGHPEPSADGTTVRVVDLVNNVIVGPPLVVDKAPAAIAITPNDAFVYTVNYANSDPALGNGTMSRIRTSDDTVLNVILPGIVLSGPFAIDITPDGNFAYVTNFGSNNFGPFGTTVSVINLSTHMTVDTITLGIQPSGLGITPDGRFAYVSNYNTLYADFQPMAMPPVFADLTPGEGTVNIIDIATNKVLPITIPVGQSPANIAVTPKGEFAYVSNFTSNTVNAIALQSFQITAQGCKISNRFLTFQDFINKITWSATGTSLPVSYSIYRDEALTDFVAEIPATSELVYFDHNRNPNVTYTYYIIGTNAVGTTSIPVAVTVTQNC